MLIRTKALVIKEHIVGESDKYITLFTKDLGRIQVLAPRAKKSDKGFASATQLFVYGEFMLTSHKDTYRLVSVEIIEMFHNIRNDLTALSYASYIMEFVHYVTEPQLPQSELLKLTLITLQQLSKGQVHFKQIRRVYELRALTLLGFMPQLFACTECGACIQEHEQSYFFSTAAGGLIDEGCKQDYKDTMIISYGTLYTMQYIVSVPFKQLYHFEIHQQIQSELDRVCDLYVSYYVDKAFKTIDFIERIEELQ